MLCSDCAIRNRKKQYIQRSQVFLAYLDLSVDGAFIVVEFIIVIWVHFDIVELELIPDSLFECLTFLQRQRVGLGDDRYDIDNVRELLEHDDVNGFQSV